MNPLGVDVASPRLSWTISDARPGAGQSAYRVLVASSMEKLMADLGDVWDSGRVESTATTDVTLEAKVLKPDSTYHLPASGRTPGIRALRSLTCGRYFPKACPG